MTRPASVLSPARIPALVPALGLVPILLLSGGSPARAADFRVESRIEPRVVSLDGHALFTLEVQGPGFQQPRLRPRFELENLEVLGAPDVSHGLSFGTGASGWHYSWTWRLRPLSAGTAAVRDIHLLVGEREVELAPRRLEVVETLPGARREPPDARAPSRSPPRSRLEELLSRRRSGYRSEAGTPREEPDLFLRAVAAPERPYVGQRVVYTVYLYTRLPVRAMEPESLPTFRGLWARDVDLQDAVAERVEWGGELYTRKPILRKELFPLAAATRVVEPVRLRIVVERVERDRLFFAPVRVPVQVVRESNPVALRVRPLPQPPAGEPGRRSLPAGFAGAVGELTLEASLDPAEVAVGEGATLTVSAAGEGHLEAVEAPAFVPPEGVDAIGPQPAAPRDDEGGASRRYWTYLLVPRRPGVWRLPALELPYFDPHSGEYRFARAPVPDLVAHRPDAGSPGPGTAGPPHTIRSAALPAPGGRPDGGWARLEDVLPWAFALPWLAALAVILTRRRRDTGRGRIAGANGALPAFYRTLETALREERPRRAAAAVERAWRGLLAEARGIPEVVPASRWPDELLLRGARREACRELRELLDDLHYLRFAPELSATASLAGELVRRSERLARNLAS